MRYVMYLLVACCMSFCGCDQLKGKQGDAGTNGTNAVVSVKTYTGTPVSNPQAISLTDNIDSTTQEIEVYATASTNQYKLPFTFQTYAQTGSTLKVLSNYIFYNEGNNVISIYSVYTDGSKPTSALYFTVQYDYKIIVRKFNTASACIAYKRSLGKLDTNPLNTLIWGREVN